MNFRQRVAALCIILSVFGWIGMFHYYHDVQVTYESMSVSEQKLYDQLLKEGQDVSYMHTAKSWAYAVPFWVWALIAIVPTLQLVLFGLVLMRPDPLKPIWGPGSA